LVHCQRATVLGDFNVDLQKSEENANRYQQILTSLCEKHSLKQLIKQPTWFRGSKLEAEPTEDQNTAQQQSLLDHIYTSDIQDDHGLLDLGQSDHFAIYIRYRNTITSFKSEPKENSNQTMALLCEKEDWTSVIDQVNCFIFI
jgi:hypothetical protein